MTTKWRSPLIKAMYKCPKYTELHFLSMETLEGCQRSLFMGALELGASQDTRASCHINGDLIISNFLPPSVLW
jgi:hypothetical protein